MFHFFENFFLAITLATCWAFYFPSVSHSVFFHSSKESETHKVAVEGSGDPAETEKLTEKNGFLPLEASKEYFSEKKPEQNSKVSVKDSFKTIFSSFKSAISDKEVLKWSLWWSASLCGYLQVNFFSSNEPKHFSTCACCKSFSP